MGTQNIFVQSDIENVHLLLFFLEWSRLIPFWGWLIGIRDISAWVSQY